MLTLIIYTILVIICLAVGSAIGYHLLHYKLNQRTSKVMFAVYILGSLAFLLASFLLLQSIEWSSFFN